MNRRMATPMYRQEHLRSVFGLGLTVGGICGGAVGAYLVLMIVRLAA